MALDSPELMEFLGVLAARYEADSILIRPTPARVWEYDRTGQLLRGDISALDVSKEGRRIYCVPQKPAEGGFWACILYDEADNVLREWAEQFPG